MRAPPPSAPGWLRGWERELVLELNTDLIDAMLKFEQLTRPGGVRVPRRDVLEQLRALNDVQRKRLAEIPVVLVDAGFHESLRWWHHGWGHSKETHVEDCMWVDIVDLHSLARKLFTFSWHLTKAHPEAAGIILGMTPTTRWLIGSYGLSGLERLILKRSNWVRPRWELRWERWQELIALARDEKSAILHQRALQFLYGDIAFEAGSLFDPAK